MKTRYTLAILLSIFGITSASYAANITWNGNAGDGLWSTAGNWSSGAVPGDEDVVTIGADMTLDIDTTIKELKFSGSPTLSGSTHTLTVLTGKISGGSKPVIKCRLAFPNDVAANVSCGQGYGNVLWIAGGVTGGASLSSTGGSQNYNIRFTNEVVNTPEITLNLNGGVFFTPVSATNITLIDSWADSNGNAPTYTFWPEATLAQNAEIAAYRGVPTILFTDQYHDTPVDFTVPSFRLRGGTRAALRCEFYGVENFVHIGAFTREPGSLLQIVNSKKGSTSFQPGVNAGFFITGIPVDANGRLPAWAYNDSYRVRKLDNGALAPCVYNDYADLSAEISADNLTGLYRLHRIQNSALVADTDIDSLVLNGNFGSTDDNTMRLNLSDYDLRLHGGALSLRDNASKEISASGDGRLVFAAEQAVFIFSGDVNRIEISAPIAWKKPVGSSVEYPDFLMPSYTGAETVFSGEDQVHNWGGLFAEGRGKGGSLLIFDGPSDRTFHGPVGGRFWMRKRGTGTLTFAGEDLTRGRQVFVEEGTLAIAHNNALAINSVTNGATLRIENGIAWSKTVVVWENSVLEGSGTVVPGLNQNYLQPECIVRGGTTNAPATLSFGGQVVIPTNIVFDVGLSGATRGKIHIGGKCTFRSNLDTKLRVRVSDVDGTAEISPTDVVTVLDWVGSTENYKAENISLVIENGTPNRIDTSAAKVEIDTTAKTITITGISTKRGTVVLFR